MVLHSRGNLISKIYKIFLRCYTEQETIKTQMVKWTINFKCKIPVSNWEYLWKKKVIYFSESQGKLCKNVVPLVYYPEKTVTKEQKYAQ